MLAYLLLPGADCCFKLFFTFTEAITAGCQLQLHCCLCLWLAKVDCWFIEFLSVVSLPFVIVTARCATTVVANTIATAIATASALGWCNFMLAVCCHRLSQIPRYNCHHHCQSLCRHSKSLHHFNFLHCGHHHRIHHHHHCYRRSPSSSLAAIVARCHHRSPSPSIAITGSDRCSCNHCLPRRRCSNNDCYQLIAV